MSSSATREEGFVFTAVRPDRWARMFVWSVWFMMILVALIYFIKYSRNIPLAEEWLFVAPLTGNEPNLVSWLWEQNNEHRVPLPRLILLAQLKLTGDFRIGVILNITILAILSFGMIRVARSLRGGRTSFTDAFFPITLLHLGHWANILWSLQLSFILPIALACGVLLVMVSHQTLTTPRVTLVTGTGLVLLTLCGATGLLYVPFLALWLGYCGILHLRSVKAEEGQRWIGAFLIGSAVLALCITGLYFVGYERPSWNVPNPGLMPTLKTTARFLALGFGPIAGRLWTLSVPAAVGLLLFSGGVALFGLLRHKGLERQRALGILVFFAGAMALALAVGWGRAGVIALSGHWPPRYALLAVPLFCLTFFIWELYGPATLRTGVQVCLLVGMCFLLPFNIKRGFLWNNYYQQGMDKVEQDLLAGTPPALLAERYGEFLIWWWDENQLAEAMQRLHEAGIGPFEQMRQEAVHR